MKKRKVAGKRSNKTKKKTAVRRKRTATRQMFKRDPFTRDQFELRGSEIGRGRTYQWVTVSVMGDQLDDYFLEMVDAGWNPVSAKRIPRLRKHWDKKRGGIVVGGQMLMERSAKLTERAKADEKSAAEAILPKKIEYRDGCNYDKQISPGAPSVGDGGYFAHLADAKKRLKELGGSVPVTIKLALTDREIDAAAICALPIETYAQRKIEMGLKWGNEPIVLMETNDGVYHIAKFKLQKD